MTRPTEQGSLYYQALQLANLTTRWSRLAPTGPAGMELDEENVKFGLIIDDDDDCTD